MLILLVACSPVRTSGSRSDTRVSDTRVKSSSSSEDSDLTANKLDYRPPRFSDTTVIRLPKVMPQIDFSLDEEFDLAIIAFEGENYADACDKFAFFAETFTPNDSLWYESRYYVAECELLKNQLAKAKGILSGLVEDGRLPRSVLERSLVRYGQLLCVEGDDAAAESYFARLRREFPNSIYMELANCAAVR